MESVEVLLLVLVSIIEETTEVLGVAGSFTVEFFIGATGLSSVVAVAEEDACTLEEATLGLVAAGNVALALSIAAPSVKIRVSSAPE